MLFHALSWEMLFNNSVPFQAQKRLTSLFPCPVALQDQNSLSGAFSLSPRQFTCPAFERGEPHAYACDWAAGPWQQGRLNHAHAHAHALRSPPRALTPPLVRPLAPSPAPDLASSPTTPPAPPDTSAKHIMVTRAKQSKSCNKSFGAESSTSFPTPLLSSLWWPGKRCAV
jgi:hypothetical protein